MPLSHNLRSVCIFEAPGVQAYHVGSIGIIVSDLTVGGSDASTTDSVGCVAKATSQTISFSMSSFLAPALDDVFFFVVLNKPCGVTPSASTDVSSDGVQMYTVVPPSSGQFTFNMDFDFSAASPSAEVYRLCVYQASSLSVLDFAPLGVRVSSITVSKMDQSVNTNAAAVTPASGQDLLISSYANQLSSNTQVWFILSGVEGYNCQCSSTASCIGGEQAETTPNTITSSDQQVMQFDFSAFTQGQPSHMCVEPPGGTAYGLDCVTVTMGMMTVSPQYVPANDGQDVILSFPGKPFIAGSMGVFSLAASDCATANYTSGAVSSLRYSSPALIGVSGQAMTFSFSRMSPGSDAAQWVAGRQLKLCVRPPSGATYSLEVELYLTKAAVGIAGDPHVRNVAGEWVDFHGEAGVYSLYQGASLEANAKLGYAVRDNHMIWHPKVMRPGTMIEEVGIKLRDADVRLGVYGGGMVSVRGALQPTVFLTATDARTFTVGDYELTWAPCSQACSKSMPWGTHERSHTLTVSGAGEYMSLSVASSGGYRFIDVESIPAAGSAGLLAHASESPVALAELLKAGGEATYKVLASLPSL